MSLHSDIEKWITDTLSIPSEIFNNLPMCPYAKQAWFSHKVLILDSENNEDLLKLLQKYEVIIYAYNPKEVTPEELYTKCKKISNDNIVALDDHPDYKESVQDINLNNGKYALILVQERAKLDQARKILKSKGYYKNWSNNYLKEVLSA